MNQTPTHVQMFVLTNAMFSAFSRPPQLARTTGWHNAEATSVNAMPTSITFMSQIVCSNNSRCKMGGLVVVVVGTKDGGMWEEGTLCGWVLINRYN